MKYQHIRSCEYLDVPPEEAAEYDKYFRFPLSSKRGTGEDTEVKKSRRKWRKKLPKRRRHWLPSLRLWWLVNVGLPLLAVYLLSLLSSSWTGSGSDSGSGRESGSSSDSDYYFLGATRTRSVELLKRIDRLWMQWLIGHDTLFATVISSCSSCASLLQSVGIDRTVFHFAVVLGVISSVIFILRRFVTFLFRFYRKPVYLMDYATLKPDDELMLDREWFMAKTHAIKDAGLFTEESAAFQERIIAKSSISDKTYMPAHLVLSPLENIPPQTGFKFGREEAEYVFRHVVADALANAGVSAKQVTHLVVNCSLFCTTPSLSSMIINMFDMKSDIKSFNLGGMGCSAGLIAIDLAKDLLRASTGRAIALVVSTENLTNNWYIGNEKGYLLSNGLFRLGGAAIVLSNQESDRHRSKFELVDAVRVHLGANDEAYDAVYQDTDSAGNTGVRLSRKLIEVAGRGITQNLTRLLTRNLFLLPLADLLRAVHSSLLKTLAGKGTKVKPFVPRFSRIFDHFCIHAGGRAVLDTLAEQLGLRHDQIQPSRAALWRFGNTSSASCWYELEWIEGRGVGEGDLVLQLAFGSGFKVNSVVWRAI